MGTALMQDVRTSDVPGLVVLDDRQLRWHRRGLALVSGVPLVGVAIAIWSLWGRGISAVDAGIFFGMYVLTGLGITTGFHRMLAHRSFRAPAPVRATLAAAGSMAIEMGPIMWVATHRRHHAFADRPGDPHSPHLDASQGFRGVLKGLWYAHMGWMLQRERTDPERWAPDLLADRPIRAIERQFSFWVTASFVLPAILGGAITRTWTGALTAFLWGGLVRIFVLHHVTFSINSICHFYGRRPFETRERSTNNWLIALPSFGEAWHNNHHAFPWSAMLGHRWWQVDVGGLLVRALEATRLATRVRKPTAEQLAAAELETDLAE